MSDKRLSGIPFAVLRDFVTWIETEKIPCVIIGGIASSLLGRPRVTRDIDSIVIIDNDHMQEFVSGGSRFGFIPRIQDIYGFAQCSRVLLMKHEPTEIDIDISLGALPFEHETIERSKRVDIGGLSLPLPMPEDLIIMKAIAHRQRDMADIEAIVDANPSLDFWRIRMWVGEFSSLLEMPEILNDLDKILAEGK